MKYLEEGQEEVIWGPWAVERGDMCTPWSRRAGEGPVCFGGFLSESLWFLSKLWHCHHHLHHAHDHLLGPGLTTCVVMTMGVEAVGISLLGAAVWKSCRLFHYDDVDHHNHGVNGDLTTMRKDTTVLIFHLRVASSWGRRCCLFDRAL